MFHTRCALETLGLKSTTPTQKQIIEARNRLVKLYHPDKNGEKSSFEKSYAEEKTKEINEAFRVLSDKKLKDLYLKTMQKSGVAQAWKKVEEFERDSSSEEEEEEIIISDTDEENDSDKDFEISKLRLELAEERNKLIKEKEKNRVQEEAFKKMQEKIELKEKKLEDMISKYFEQIKKSNEERKSERKEIDQERKKLQEEKGLFEKRAREYELKLEREKSVHTESVKESIEHLKNEILESIKPGQEKFKRKLISSSEDSDDDKEENSKGDKKVKAQGPKNFVCLECGKAYGLKQHLIRHQRCHIEHKYYCENQDCPYSKNGLASKDSLKVHQKRCKFWVFDNIEKV